LLDTDMVAMRPLDADMLERCARLGAAAFDISDQVFPAYGSTRVITDLEVVAGRRLANPRWYGGEFLLCTQGFLKLLVPRGKVCFTRYVAHVHHLHHNGDEAFVSAALSMLVDEGQPIVDVGAYQAVGRHWPGNTHRNLDWFRRCAFLHLPGNKELIERESHRPEFDPDRLWRMLWIAHKVGRVRAMVKSLLKRPTPRLREMSGKSNRSKKRIGEKLRTTAERDAST
ncbi:MAG TPA: hypothetical protein VGZ01_13145, partial [Trinickia sp.]|nr:hypothetical protein [Trinickia sp.]